MSTRISTRWSCRLSRRQVHERELFNEARRGMAALPVVHPVCDSERGFSNRPYWLTGTSTVLAATFDLLMTSSAFAVDGALLYGRQW